MYLPVMMINYCVGGDHISSKTISGLYLKAPMTWRLQVDLIQPNFFSSLIDVVYARAVTKGAADRAIKQRICDKERSLRFVTCSVEFN